MIRADAPARAEAQDLASRDSPLGGQAVIEGVMMRSPDGVATAVRNPEGDIVVKRTPHVPLSRRYRVLGIPVLRGAISFFEMLVIGLQALRYSADLAMEEEEATRTRRNAWSKDLMLGATVFLAFALGIGVFFLLPLALTNGFGLGRGQFAFNVVAGAFRIGLLLAYLWSISRWGEMRRVFQYHGAEHKTIFAFEAGEELTVENARRHTTFHPRCGTSFLLIVAILAILLFSAVDSAFVTAFGHRQSLFERFATHLVFLPLVAGGSYEMLKLSGRMRNHRVVRALIAPGLWIQRITTCEPDDGQLEVALVALRSVLEDGEA